MKKFYFLLILMFFWLSVACFASNVADKFLPSTFENYLIISDKPVKKVSSANPKIADVKILSTIMNERNMVILNSISEGKTVLTFNIDGKNIEIKVQVKKNKTIICKEKGFEYLLMDVPPEVLKIDSPPKVER